MFVDQWSVQANQWPIGENVSLTIQHRNAADDGWDDAYYDETFPSVDAPWDPGMGQFVAQFDIGEAIVAGDLVTASGDVSGSPVVKEHVVTGLAFTGVNVDTDTVSGTAEPDSTVWVNIHGSGLEDFETTANGWRVVGRDARESTTETQGYAYQADDDGDRTQIDWPYFPEQNFNVFVDQRQVHAYQWPVGTDVTLTAQRLDPVIEDFEDGDADGWTGHGSMDVVTSPLNPNGGTYVGKTNIGATGDCNGQYLVFDQQTPDRFRVDFLGTGDTTTTAVWRSA